MNKNRRKELKDVADMLKEDIIELLNDTTETLGGIMMDEQDAFDSLPDSLQSSERGTSMEQNVSDIENVIGKLDSVVGDIEHVISRINKIVER